jgi:hypothetical protein
MLLGLKHIVIGTSAFALLVSTAPAWPQEAEERRGRPEWSDRPPPRPSSPVYNDDDCWRLYGWERRRCEERRDRHRREEEEKRKDAKAKGVVAGVVGTMIGAALIGAMVSNSKKDKPDRRTEERRRYCLDRYGNYDVRTDSYRASDGRSYRCE